MVPLMGQGPSYTAVCIYVEQDESNTVDVRPPPAITTLNRSSFTSRRTRGVSSCSSLGWPVGWPHLHLGGQEFRM